jgi:hypothetical protein
MVAGNRDALVAAGVSAGAGVVGPHGDLLSEFPYVAPPYGSYL